MFKKLKAEMFVFNYIGSLLVVFGVLLLLPLIPGLIYGEFTHNMALLDAFVLPSVGSIVLGIMAQKRIPVRTPTVKEGMMITALAWICTSIIGGVPFMLGLDKPFIDAVFETSSGLTTTGITVFTGLDSMSKALLFWRAFIQWVGGLGILTFFLAVSFRGGSISVTLFGSESHKISSPRPVPGIFRTLKILWSIYGFFTITSLILFWIEGMNFFDALTHSFTAISTGGFSTHDDSIAFFSHFSHGSLIEYTVIFFMLMGGINFLVHFRVLTGKWRSCYKDFEIKWFWGILLISTMLIVIDHLVNCHTVRALTSMTFGRAMETLEDIFRISLFQVASLITSTGYATKDINSLFFPALAKQVFMFLMLVGGCVGSTAGGIKVLRIGILVQAIKSELSRLASSPKSVTPVVVEGNIIGYYDIRLISSLLCSWLALIFFGAGITAFFSDLNAWQSLSGMLSAMGNMGPFYFSVSKMASLHPIIKATYIFGMIAGRLELLPLFVLIFSSTWR